MINLLLKEEKRKVKKEYAVRLATTALFLVFALLFLGVVSLAPRYIAYSIGEESIRAQLDTSLSEIAEEGKKLDQAVQKTNMEIRVLQEGKRTRSYSEEVLGSVLSRAKNVSLQSFAFSDEGDGTAKLRVSGQADSREDLVSFSKSLEEVPFFESVDVPISNFVKGTDIEFSIEIVARTKTP